MEPLLFAMSPLCLSGYGLRNQLLSLQNLFDSQYSKVTIHEKPFHRKLEGIEGANH
jgi:hypothetical protein